MKILHVITGLEAGGAERQLRDLVARQRFASEVAVLTRPGLISQVMQADGVKVHHLGMRNNRDVRVLVPLWRLVRSGGYDVIHTHLFRAGLYGRIAAWMAGTSVVVASEHSIGDQHFEGRRITGAIRALSRAVERLGNVTIAVSSAAARRLAGWGIPAERIEVIANGVDAKAFAFDPAVRQSTRTQLTIPSGGIVVGAVGRLEPGKRFDVLIEAIATIPDTVLLLVGDGPERARLVELARRLGILHRVILTGASDEVPALLSAMDVFAAPSQEETFGLAVIEAMACGLPVLYSACPALEELPADAAPGARRLPSTAEHYHRAISDLIHTGISRLPPSPAVAHYSIELHVERVEALYTRVRDQRSQSKVISPAGRKQ
ncbi:glycosyltransferase [Nonomuraea soli]|uniref:Glycosyltransferase involved in cell wall biosynthesis n=1 Tax=Nonomuraea soli TaxID=1032476 RepID=A0A7W0HQ03_9ACTN|nr:glycosyltransferase [Nonomuraea soli]MBA2891400.1 glycosyltransferase involved in cell wall biosynthesis [Nonomuraea soli]